MSTKPKFRVVALDHGFATTEPEERIIRGAGGEFMNVEGRPYPVAMAFCHEADVVLCRRMIVTEPMVEHLYRAKAILRYGVGADNIDLRAATLHRIMVGCILQPGGEETALHTLALLLACVRDLLGSHRKVLAGGWDVRRETALYRMSGRTLGLVGFGCVAQELARRLQGWGLTLIAADPYADEARAQALGVRLVGLQTLCAEADYISLHLPLLPETRHLIGPNLLATMKPGVILINTARGALIHTPGLLAALNQGRVARVGLDVFDEEPLPADSPLRRHPRVLLSDHCGWYSEEAQLELQQQVAEEAVRVSAGSLPIAVANPDVLTRLGRAGEWTPPEPMRWQLKRVEAVPQEPVPEQPTIFTASPNLLEVARSLQRMQRPTNQGDGKP